VVTRAKIVLLAADGGEKIAIAGRLDVAVQLVSKWRKWFYEEGLPAWKIVHGLVGRGLFPPVAVVGVKALACELPAESGVPLSRWSTPEPPRRRTPPETPDSRRHREWRRRRHRQRRPAGGPRTSSRRHFVRRHHEDVLDRPLGELLDRRHPRTTLV
jgi:hypothetical protein